MNYSKIGWLLCNFFWAFFFSSTLTFYFVSDDVVTKKNVPTFSTQKILSTAINIPNISAYWHIAFLIFHFLISVVDIETYFTQSFNSREFHQSNGYIFLSNNFSSKKFLCLCLRWIGIVVLVYLQRSWPWYCEPSLIFLFVLLHFLPSIGGYTWVA